MANLTGRLKLLQGQFDAVKEYCMDNDKITYRILKCQLGTQLPSSYEFTFQIKSIIGINQRDKSPIYGYEHKVEISFTEKYPEVGAKIIAQTDIWHPNIKYFDPGKGHICSNQEGIGHEGLYGLLFRLYEIIGYKNYLAENIFPYPEDLEVATWVREVGEPKGYISLLVSENFKSNDQGPIPGPITEISIKDMKGLLIDFIEESLRIGVSPVHIVDVDDINPDIIVTRFLTKNSKRYSVPPGGYALVNDLKQLAEDKIKELDRESKIWGTYDIN